MMSTACKVLENKYYFNRFVKYLISLPWFCMFYVFLL